MKKVLIELSEEEYANKEEREDCGKLEGYTPDFYECLREKLNEGKDCISAISICEILYG